ncbi:MAG TPA: carboxymuconolactone decarboxylase family protein [Thermoleophilaceae bacterium]
MTREIRGLGDARRVLRWGLVALALMNAPVGVWATISPHSFYTGFPGAGRHWVSALGPYDEHLVRDVASLELAITVLFLLAAVWLTRRLAQAALIASLFWALPHFLYHLATLDRYGLGDSIGNVVGLGAELLLPLALLWVVPRAFAPAAPGAAAPPAPGERGRIAPAPERGLWNRLTYGYARREAAGTVPDPVRVFAHNRKISVGYGAIEKAFAGSHRVDERLKTLAELRAASIAGCEWCLDFGSALAKGADISQEKLMALPRYGESQLFEADERLVLDYATAMSRSPVEVSDELFERLRARFDEAQLVELTGIIALENFRARFNDAVGLGAQGYSDGSFCVLPEREAVTR